MSDVERVIRFDEQLRLAHVAHLLGNPLLWLVHETHHHADGSQSETYYLELTEAQHQGLHVYGQPVRAEAVR